MKKTIGVFAHIDAGKTTFCEQLLFLGGAIRKTGRVDHGDSFFDTHQIERERGVTVFAHEGRFEYGGNSYCLIDTPGHADFSAETERACAALDAAIILVDGTSGVRPQTRALFSLLKTQGKPCFFFINKTDMESCDVARTLSSLRDMLDESLICVENAAQIKSGDDALCQEAAMYDEDFMARYFDGEADGQLLLECLQNLVMTSKVYPVLTGSALLGRGVEEFLEVLDLLTVTNYDASLPFRAQVFRIRVAEQIIAFLKVEQGTLQVRDAFEFDGTTEKISAIRLYQADRFETAPKAEAGQIAAVTGLPFAACGMVLKQGGKVELSAVPRRFLPALQAKMSFEGVDIHTALSALRTLEKEDPTLNVVFDEEHAQLMVHVMGDLQLEVLQRVMQDRFSIAVSFGAPQAAYRETIASPVIGIGHYEPLRHYAEVMLAIEPAPRGSGISFESRCHVDDLPLQYQNAIGSFVMQRVHRGVLTGAPLCDVKCILLAGGVHDKHTEGGDLRQSTWRAVRQGLEKAENMLLEPFYRYEITVPQKLSGRVMSDMQMMHGTCEGPVFVGAEAVFTGRAPAQSLNGYAQTLAAASGGMSGCAVFFDGYDVCVRANEVIEEIGYDRVLDKEHTSCSVFCQKGAGFTVDWREADALSHTRNGRSDEELLVQFGVGR